MIKVAVIGLGPIGIAAAKLIQQDNRLELSGLVDINPVKQSKYLNELDSEAVPGSPPVVESLEQVDPKPQIAIVTTGSHFDRLAPTLRDLIRHQIHGVTSCEQMIWPWFRHPHLADVIHTEATKAGVTLVGTGVNPGFVMDLLPVVLSSMVGKVRKVRVVRVVDALTRRLPLQRKIGSTMTVEKFKSLADEEKIGHMGIGESVVMLAQGLGHHPMQSDVRITLEPVVADQLIRCDLGEVKPGFVCGMRNTGRYARNGLEIELDLKMALAANDPRDEIEIVGERTIKMLVPGSTPGDTATSAALVNVARKILQAPRGLKTMLDLPPCGSASL
jgi:4-hydroxy-tetrahydrodipicolinate reductase